MDMFIQLLISGILVGTVYGLIALGFVLVYKASGILNLAQGELVMLGAYICYTGISVLHLNVALAFLFTFVIAGVMGIVISRVAIRPLVGQPLLSVIMMTIVLSIGLRGISILVWGAETEGLNVFGHSYYHIAGAVISEQSIWAFALSVLAVIAFAIYFQKTKGGRAMRAVADDQQGAQSVGIKIVNVFDHSWLIAAVVGALGGILLASGSGVSIELTHLGLKVLPVVLIGGLDSIQGAIVGGVIVGIAENMAVGYLDPVVSDWGLIGGGLRNVFPYILALFILVVRPYGLFGQKRIERI